MFKKSLFCLLFTVINSAMAKPILTVYTYNSFCSEWSIGPIIKTAFEQKYHCTLKFVVLEDGLAILKRLRLEGRNSQADIVIGLDSNLKQDALDTGLFVPHSINTKKLSLPGGWHDNIFLPYDYGYLAFIYNCTKLKKPPHSLHELVENSQSLKIIYEDPRTSTPALGLLLWIQKIYGENSRIAWKKLAEKTVTVTKGWSEAYTLFMNGEADMVLSYTTSPGYHIFKEKTNHYIAAIFNEGHYQQVELMGQLSTSKQQDLAHYFMQFILTPALQKLIPIKNWMYPVININLPVGFPQPPQKTLRFTSQQVAAKRNEWISSWQQIVSS